MHLFKANKNRKKPLLAAVGTIITLLCALTVWLEQTPEIMQRLELDLYDIRLRQNLPQSQDDRIAIVDIDERSLSELGRWPWSRLVIAELVETLLQRYQVAVIGFDVIFAEPDDRVSISRLADWADQIEHDPNLHNLLNISPDQILANTLENTPVVLGTAFYSDNPNVATGSPGTPLNIDASRLQHIPIVEAQGFVGALPELVQVSRTGFFDNPLLDRDGVFRKMPLLQKYGEHYYPSLALSLWQTLIMSDEIYPIISQGLNHNEMMLEGINAGGLKIPVNSRGAMLVPYRGGMGSFPYYSATDIIKSRISPDALAGRIVLIGTSAAALHDQRATPVGQSYPGVEIHANLLSAFLDERFYFSPDFVNGLNFLQVILAGGILSALLPFLSVLTGAFLTISLISAVIIINIYLFTDSGWVTPLSPPLVTAALVFLIMQTLGFMQETRTRHKLFRTFGQYVPQKVVEELQEYDTAGQLQGTSREMTVLFSDIRGFTSMSEKLSPVELTRLMNIYLSGMTAEIHQHKGTIDKYIGDAVMAFWGAPVPDKYHAEHAVRAGLAMLNALPDINQRLNEEGLPAVDIGIGINTGVMSVGNMGSDFRMAYTVMGDAVNLASRAEGLTKFYGVKILVTETVTQQCPDLSFRSLDLARVKGKKEAVEFYEPLLGLSPVLNYLAEYDNSLELYRSGDLDKAKGCFEQLIMELPEDQPIKLYLQRISQAEKTRLEDWDPVYNHLEK